MGLAPKLLQSVPKMLNILCSAPVNGLSYTILMLKGIIRSTTAQGRKKKRNPTKVIILIKQVTFKLMLGLRKNSDLRKTANTF